MKWRAMIAGTVRCLLRRAAMSKSQKETFGVKNSEAIKKMPLNFKAELSQ